MPLGKCRLHLEEADLKLSHIVPNWVYRRSVKAGGRGGNVLLHVGPETISADPTQLKEHLLCEVCEAVIKPSEDHVSKLTWQLDGKFPALDAVDLLPEFFGENRDLKIGVVRPEKMRPEEVAKFAASVFWRASVASLNELQDCKLRRYEEDFRLYLRDEAPFPSCARLVVELFNPPDDLPLDQISTAPSGRRFDGHHHRFDFVALGMHFVLAVGGQLPREFNDFCFVHTHHVLVGMGEAFTRMLARQMATTPRKGKIAEALPKPWESD